MTCWPPWYPARTWALKERGRHGGPPRPQPPTGGRPRPGGGFLVVIMEPWYCAGARAGSLLRRLGWGGVLVGHPARLCDSDLAGLRPGIGRGPHGRRAGRTRHLARVICGQSLDGVGREPCGRAAHLRRDPDQYRRGSHPASPGRGLSGAPLGGLSEPAHPYPRHRAPFCCWEDHSAAW